MSGTEPASTPPATRRLPLSDYTFNVHAQLRRLLLLLLILVLPVEALASSVMQVCILPDRVAAGRMALSDAAMEGMTGCHATPDQPHSPPAQHTCKYCAACALAPVLPIEFAGNMLLVPVANGFGAQVAASFSGFIPDGPERPPRPPLA